MNGAHVRLTCTMLDMNMGALTGPLPQTGSGRYEHAGLRLMFGHWGLRLDVVAPHAAPFTVNLVDHIGT